MVAWNSAPLHRLPRCPPVAAHAGSFCVHADQLAQQLADVGVAVGSHDQADQDARRQAFDHDLETGIGQRLALRLRLQLHSHIVHHAEDRELGYRQQQIGACGEIVSQVALLDLGRLRDLRLRQRGYTFFRATRRTAIKCLP